MCMCCLFVSSRRRHTRCALVTGVQTCALPILLSGEMGPRYHSPKSLGGTPLSLCIYVPDIDAFTERAQAAGAEVIEPLENKFYGDRAVTLRDPAGHEIGRAACRARVCQYV